MKLLLDQNLSPRIIGRCRERFPGSIHVRDAGLSSSRDSSVWRYAATHGFLIVSKDADFHQRSLVFGHPPKVIWIRRGNCSTETVIALLEDHTDQIAEFAFHAKSGFLTIE